MAADWAPNAPGTIGLPWFVDTVQDIGPSAGRGMALTVDSTAAETIAAAYVGIGSVSQAGYMLTEVFPVASVVPGATTTSSFAPNGVLTGDGSTWETNAGSTTAANLAGAVDNGVINTAVYDEYTGTLAQHTRLEFLFPTAGALWPANQRVLSGALVFAAALTDSTGQLQVWYNQAGTRVLMGTVTVTTDIQTYAVPLGEINPVTNLPWTRAQVQDFDVASGFGFRPLTGTAKPLRIYDVRLDLDWVTEDRVAVGTLALTPTDTLAWATVPLQTPNGGAANWAKGNATTYTVVVRPPTGPLSTPAGFTVRTLGETGVTTLPQGSIPYRPVLGTGGAVVSEGDPVAQAMALAFDIDASATDSADGQPYLSPLATSVASPNGQTISGAGAATYSQMRAVVVVDDSASNAVAEWEILGPGPVVLDSGQFTQAQIESTGTFLFTDAQDGGAVFLLDVPVSVALAAATTYTITWDTISGSGSITPLILRTSAPATGTTHGDPATYGGTTLDFGTTDSYDWPVTLSTQPTTPTGFQASIFDRTTGQATGPPGSCGYSTLEEIRLQWNATAVGAAFAYYEIERSADQGVTWDLVYRITDEDVDQATDQEHPYNTEVWYRLRTVRAGDLIPSDWSANEQITANVEACPLVFSSNLLPALVQGYPRQERITWQQPSSDEVNIVAPSGADYHTALIADENRGDIFNQSLKVWSPGFNALVDPPAPGRDMFDPIIELTRAAIPYVCVRDETGHVWYANVNVTEGTRAEPFHEYNAEAVVTELTDTPAVIDETAALLAQAVLWYDARSYGDSTGDLVNLGTAGDTYDAVPDLPVGPGTDIVPGVYQGVPYIHVAAAGNDANFEFPDGAAFHVGVGDSATQMAWYALAAPAPLAALEGIGMGQINAALTSGWGGVDASAFVPASGIALVWNDGDNIPPYPADVSPAAGVLTLAVSVLDRDAATMTLYLDGEQVDQTSATGLGALTNTNGGHIAGNGAAGGQYFSAAAFWDRALTPAEVAQITDEIASPELPAPTPSLYEG